ncbi:958_t:CDS:2 [Diversispora eburnea]|uniref:Actin-related protein 2/3 complex subunit 5 n=1 Tax=Diversispora eburnea TaxID=1213867 RepID=A0A9N9FP79_9GLOM|nr:958_t:CDS:2 [Diversispora eburnea]
MSFRSIDVDALDDEPLVQEELFCYSDGTEIDPQEALNNVQTKGIEVRNLLTKNNSEDALITAISDPPYGLNTTDAKVELNAKIVMDVLNSIKATDILSLIKRLSIEQQDVLMKYIYCGMARVKKPKEKEPPEPFNSAVLLNWHEKLTEIAGVGCIVRVITDRKTV